MISSQRKSILYEVLRGEAIPSRTLTYFRRRLSNRLHSLVLEEFARLEAEKKINKAELARRIGRAPELITRWLGGPGNWTTDTLSDLMLGMGCEPDLTVKHLKQASERKETPATLRLITSAQPHATGEEPVLVKQLDAMKQTTSSSTFEVAYRQREQKDDPAYGQRPLGESASAAAWKRQA